MTPSNVPIDFGTRQRPRAVPIDEWVPTAISRDPGNARPPVDVETIQRFRRQGYSVRRISYLTGIPHSTVGDVCKRDHDSLPEPMPFYRLVEY